VAAGVALYISARQHKLMLTEKAEVKCDIVRPSGPEHTAYYVKNNEIDIFTDAIRLSIFNTGLKPFSIQYILLYSSEIYEKCLLPERDLFDKTYNMKKIEYGDSIQFQMSILRFTSRDYVRTYYKKLKKPRKSLELCIETSRKTYFYCKFPEFIYDAIEKNIK
jgi:hypothetical protein